MSAKSLREAVSIGLDWGGTKIEGIALGADGSERVRVRIATPTSYDAALDAVIAMVRGIESKLGLTRPATLGVGIPGAVSAATGLVKNANTTWLIGRPLVHDLGTLLDRTVTIENDANCLALSEAMDGAGSGDALVWAVILGTGAGSGIAVDRRVLTGRGRIAGEWGHNPLPWAFTDESPGPSCYCGRTGCIETWVSGPGFAADHARRNPFKGSAVPALRAEDIVLSARNGGAAARATFDLWLDRLARSLAHVVNILDPDVIVFGGGLSKIGEIYARLPELMARHVFTDAFDTPLRPALHGDSSGVRGAAWLGRDAARAASSGPSSA